MNVISTHKNGAELIEYKLNPLSTMDFCMLLAITMSLWDYINELQIELIKNNKCGVLVAVILGGVSKTLMNS